MLRRSFFYVSLLVAALLSVAALSLTSRSALAADSSNENGSQKKKTLVIEAKARDGSTYQVIYKKIDRENLSEEIAEQLKRRSTPSEIESTRSFNVISSSSELAQEVTSLTRSMGINNLEVKQTTIDLNLAQKVRQGFQRTFPKVKANDLWMATALLPLATGASAASYYLTDTPLSLSLMISIGAGLYASGFQVFIEYWKNYIAQSKSWVGKLGKFHMTEVAFLTIPPAVFLTSGHLPPKGFAEYVYLLGQINLVALGSTLTQGYLEKELVDLEKADLKKGIHRKFLGANFANLGFLTGSTVSIFSALSALSAQHIQGAESLQYLAYIGFGSLIAGGYSLYYYRTRRFLPKVPFLNRLLRQPNPMSKLTQKALRCERAL